MATDVFASLNGVRVRTLTLVMPLWGTWTADALLDESVTVSDGKAALELGDLALAGFVYRAGDFTGTGSFRLVGGFGGWGKDIGPKFYQNPSGLKLSTVLGDAAKESGEKVSVESDRSIGFFYARQRGPAIQTMRRYVTSWWVRNDGTTVVADRATPTIASPFDVIPEGSRLGIGRITVATDKPSDWVPGSFFSAPVLSTRQISAVVHRLTADTFRSEIWTTP